MYKFPLANSFFNKTCIQSDKLRALLPQFEEALDGNHKIRQDLEAIQAELQALKFHSSIFDQINNISAGAQNTATMVSNSVETFYDKIVQIEELVHQVGMEKILHYTVKCKEDQTLREINSIKKAFDHESKQLDALESRSLLKNFRQLQILLESNQNGLAVLQQEVDNMERQMLNKIKRATDYRNKKIIHILQTSKLIDPLELKSPGLTGSQSRLDLNRRKRPSTTSVGSPVGLILQPALDFLSKFMQTNDDDKNPDPKNDANRRNSAPSPSKQVRFMPPPDLECVHIVNRLSSMSTDDGSVERAKPTPHSGRGSNKSSEMLELVEKGKEFEDSKDLESEDDAQEVEFEAEEAEGDLEMDFDGQELSGDDKLGAKGTRKNRSTQPEKLPQWEESEKEDESSASSDAKDKELQEMSVNNNRVEVPKVGTIPSSGATSKFTFTPEDSGSKYSRFKLTASQKTSHDAMDVDEGDADRQEEASDENEIFVIPMAQPKPTQSKHSVSVIVSPSSSDRADSMLNFSEPNYEFNDDFWTAKHANDNTNTGQFYNL